jgi:superfamily II DNA or RNA helicase
MTNKCTLEIKDEVNIQFHGVDANTRRKLVQSVEFFLPAAKYSPAYKLGRWNGMMSYCDIGARSYLNLLDTLLPVLDKEGYEIEVDDKRDECNLSFTKVDENSYSHITWPKGHQLDGQPIVLKEHQVEVINAFFSEAQGITVAPTGSGKTIISAVLAHRAEVYGRTITIVPTKDLVTQTEEDFKNLKLDVGVYFGDRKEYNKKHTICTWQSLEVMNKATKEEAADIDAFLEGVVCVIVDETHKAKADALRKLLSGPLKHAPIRWGMTGTLPEQEHDRLAVLACIGPVLGKLNTKDLQDKGILAELHVTVLQTQETIQNMGVYQTELKWLTTHQKRLTYFSNYVATVATTGNTLVLVDRIETGEELELLIPNSVFVSGRTKSAARKEEYDEVKESDDKVIIATYGVASTGINIVRIYNLFLFEPGKSFVRVIQSIGRGIRVAPDKDFVNIYDFCANTKYSKQHLTKRKKFYTEAQYPYTITKVTY